MIHYAQYGCDGVGNIRLAARCDSDGDCTLALSDGRTLTVAAASAVDDGHALFLFHTASDINGTLTHGGEQYEYTMSIRPLKPERIRMVVWSCASSAPDGELSYKAMHNAAPDLLLCLGDFVYADATGGSYNSEPRVSVRELVIEAATPEVYSVHYRAVKRGRNFREMAANCPLLCTWDDHEIFDGWSMGGINNINKYKNQASAVEQIPESDSDAVKSEKMARIYDLARTAFYEQFGMTNPPNIDSDAHEDALYFRVRVGSTLELIVPDHMTYRDIQHAANDNGYTNLAAWTYYDDTQSDQRQMFYPQQMSWVLTALENAQSDGVAHKVLGMAKQPYEHNAGAANNNDTFFDHSTERDTLVEAFDDLTGAVWIAGDSHQAVVYRNDEHNFLCYEPCSLSSGLHQQGDGYNTNVAWKIWGSDGQPGGDRPQWVFGIADFTPAQQTHRIAEAKTGRTLWGPYRINAGEVATKPRRTRIG